MAEKKSKTEEVLSPPLPANLEAERGVLGAIILDNQAFYPAVEIVGPTDFWYEAHRVIFSKMIELERAKQAIDLVTLHDRLEQAGDVERAGGSTYLAALVDGVPRVSNIEYYCNIVKEKATFRRLVNLADGTMSSAMEARGPASEAINELEESIGVIREEYETGKSILTVKDAVQEIMPVLQRVGSGDHVLLGTPTGFSDIDELMPGWVAGEFICLGARPSEGKTALGMEFLTRLAQRGIPTLMFSLEMSRASVIIRLACREAMVDIHRFRSGWLEREGWTRLTTALQKVKEYPIYIDDRPSVWANEIRWRVRALAKRVPIKLVVVDYLQLVNAKGERRVEQVSAISSLLKATARDLGNTSGGALLALSQLTRIKKKERPQLIHLRESGQIEQDSDTVMFIYNAETKAEPGQKNPVVKYVEVAKQRNGPTGRKKLVFLPEYVGFEPFDQRLEDL